jgi:magnesium and cobalt exporter, CNNM family
MTEWLLLLLSLALVLACGAFVAAEFALITVDRASVERAAAAGDRRAKGTVTALRTLSTQLSGAQVGITVTNLAIGFLAEPAISRVVAGPLGAAGVPAGAVPGVSLGLGLALGTAATMVFGELVPKNLAIAEPLATARATQGFQRGFTTAMAWPIRALNGTANRVVRAFGIEPQEKLASARGPEELAALVRRSAHQGVLERPTAHLLERTLAFGAKTADDIKTPRVRVHFVVADAPASAVIELTCRTGHSRFPVVRESVDDVVGAVHVKQAVAVPVGQRDIVPVSAIMSAPLTVPETLALDPLLALLRGHGMQMAVVVDEYGGTDGVVTLEDVVEEIVGDIADEHDRLGAHVRRHRDGSWSISGLLRPDEVRDLTGVALPEDDDFDTVAGLVLDRLGRLPAVGESVTVGLVPPTTVADLDAPEDDPQVAVLTVERLDGRRVDRLRLAVTDAPIPADAADTTEDAR